MTRRNWLAVAAGVVLLSGCATPQQYMRVATPLDTELYAAAGQTVLRVELTRDLPNAFGGADIWGGKVEAGYTELRYAGMRDYIVVFKLIEVQTNSRETTVSRRGFMVGGAGPTAAALIAQAQGAESPTGETREVLHSLNDGNQLSFGPTKLTIVRATPTGLTYRLR